jgi:pimeloyl-ACP methyl ester carboxylesterase
MCPPPCPPSSSSSPPRPRPRTTLGPAVLAMLLPFFALFFPGCRPTTGKAFAELAYPEPVAAVRTVQVGSVRVAYTEHGQGESALVLVHGLGSYLPAWKDNVAALARDHRVIAIDLPGYGKSSKRNDYAYSMEFFATVVQGVIDELDLWQPVIVGHSMGGQIALTHALRHPGKARALVLTSPAGLETFEDGEAQWLADAVTDDFTCKATPEAIYARHIQNFHRMPRGAHFMAHDRVAVIGGPDFPQYCRAVSRSVRAMLDEPVYARLPEVDVPVLVVFGRYDQLIPNPFLHGGSTERLAEKTVPRLPKGELVMLPSAGHMAQMEQADAWNRAVLEFLRKLPAPPAPEPEPEPEATPDDAVEDDAAEGVEGDAAEEPDPDPRRKLPPSAVPEDPRP